jgi:hypothetical protein
MSTRRLIPLLLLLALALGACDSGSGESTTSTSPGTAPSATGPATTAAETTTTTTTTLPPGTEELPEAVRAELADLIAATEAARQLEFLEQPSVVVVTDEELAERVREQLEEDLEDLPADQALYRLLGLIEPDVDLGTLYTDLYSEQVAGYYDGEVGELVVPMAEDGFTVLQRATLVHELTHALTDQHYGFHDRYSELLDGDRYDEASALQALIEGDAVLAELLYLRSLTPEEQAEFFTESFGVDSQQFDAAPRFIRDALVFPYDSGFVFVDRLYRTGGFDAIAEAYASPPTSTEQIIDPDDYPADEPVAVDVGDLSLDGFELEYESTWGELGFALMFDQVVGDTVSDTAAGGWGGDEYQVHFDGSEVVLVLRYRGDAAADAEEMRTALNEYVRLAMGFEEAEELEGGSVYRGEDHAWVWSDGNEVVFVASSDADAFDAAVASLIAFETDTTGTTDTTAGG